MKIEEPTLFDMQYLNPFYGVRIYLSGTFSKPKKNIVLNLKNAGAITNMGLSRKTYVVIAGSNQKQDDIFKIATFKNDGYNIPVISELDMYDLLSGRKYDEFKEPVKDIQIDYDFMFSKEFPKLVHMDSPISPHVFGEKEVYIHGDLAETYPLRQALGNIGAYTTAKFDPQYTDYCWLTSNTIRLLENNIKDDFINCIADTYNKSKSEKFTYKFILADEVVSWMKSRAIKIGDTISLEYINSISEKTL